MITDGAVELYYDSAKKFETTSTGIDVTGDIQLDATDANIWLKSGASGTNGFINWTFNTDSSVFSKIGIDYDTRASTGFHIDAGYPITIDAVASGGKAINFAIAGTTKALIDGSGNVGVGTTPKAYHSDYKAIDINNSASVMGYTGNNGAWLMENLYFGTDGNWKHKNSDFSALVEMYDGVFNVYNTASGTAGATATLQNRLKIDTSGNVEIGTSNPSGNKGITIQAGTNSSASLRLKNDAQDWDINCQTNDTFAIYNQTSSTQPFSILPNGKVGIGTATPLSVTQGLHVVHANNEGNPTYTGAEVGIFQRNFNSSQGAAISIVGGSNSESTVNFADKDDANIGQINYQHGTNSMLFRTNDTVQLSMSNTGKMIIAPAGNITKDYRTLWNTSSTGTHYIKLYDKTGTTPNKHLHFQMYSENNSEHSVEVKVMLPTYSGFLSNYGDYTAGQGPHVEILAGGLSSQANTFSEIIAVADTSSTNDYTEIWLKIDPPATNTAISIAEFPESEVITATTSDWTTTAPSNIQKRYPIVCGQHSINNVNIGQDGNVGIGTTSPNSLLEIKGSEPILTIRDTRNVGGTGWSDTANEALGEIQFWTSDGTGIGLLQVQLLLKQMHIIKVVRAQSV
jgi:hypothetical protein